MDTLETPWGEIPVFGAPPGEEERQLLLKVGALSFLPGSHILVIGLGSGVVPACLGLRKFRVTAVTDSAREQRDTLQTWITLGLPETHLVLGDILTFSASEFQAAVLCRPRSPLLWAEALQWARRSVSVGFPIIAAPPHPNGYLEWKKWIGAGGESGSPDRVFQGTIPEGPVPPWTAKNIDFPPLKAKLVLHPALPIEVPSESTAALLRLFPKPASRAKIVVRGEDTVILGIAAAKTNKEAQVWCVTDSFSTLWSARESFQASGVGKQGGFLASDTLEDFDRQTVDLVLWSVKDGIDGVGAREIKDVLKPGGELWVVAPENSASKETLKAAGYIVRTAGGRGAWTVLRALLGSL